MARVNVAEHGEDLSQTSLPGLAEGNLKTGKDMNMNMNFDISSVGGDRSQTSYCTHQEAEAISGTGDGASLATAVGAHVLSVETPIGQMVRRHEIAAVDRSGTPSLSRDGKLFILCDNRETAFRNFDATILGLGESKSDRVSVKLTLHGPDGAVLAEFEHQKRPKREMLWLITANSVHSRAVIGVVNDDGSVTAIDGGFNGGRAGWRLATFHPSRAEAEALVAQGDLLNLGSILATCERNTLRADAGAKHYESVDALLASVPKSRRLVRYIYLHDGTNWKHSTVDPVDEAA